jgi:hypothetical protein
MRFFHWLGHVLFDMDCAVHIDKKTQRVTCKTCGRDVKIRWITP